MDRLDRICTAPPRRDVTNVRHLASDLSEVTLRDSDQLRGFGRRKIANAFFRAWLKCANVMCLELGRQRRGMTLNEGLELIGHVRSRWRFSSGLHQVLPFLR